MAGYFTGSAPAAEVQATVNVQCPAWQEEASAQVEARIRTSLLVANADAAQVLVSCQNEEPSVLVEANGKSLRRSVLRRSSSIEDDVVATAESAVRELATRPAIERPQSDETPAAALLIAKPAPKPTTVPKVEVKASDAPGLTVRRRARTEIEAAWLGERWASHWAMGARLRLSVGNDAYAYGVALAGRAALAGEPSFNASEWSATPDFASIVPQAWGIVATVRAGVSLFVASPAPSVVSGSNNLLLAACAELDLSRPRQLGSFVLTPALGVRLFSGRRNVQLNAEERLLLPWVVPEAALGYRFR